MAHLSPCSEVHMAPKTNNKDAKRMVVPVRPSPIRRVGLFPRRRLFRIRLLNCIRRLGT